MLIDTNLERNICSHTGARTFAKIYLEFAAMNGKIRLQSLLWNNLNLLPSQVSTIFQNISKNVLPEKRELSFAIYWLLILSKITFFPNISLKLIKSLRSYEFLLLQFELFSSIFGFSTFTCYKKFNDGSIYKIMSGVFWLGIILDRLRIKLY